MQTGVKRKGKVGEYDNFSDKEREVVDSLEMLIDPFAFLVAKNEGAFFTYNLNSSHNKVFSRKNRLYETYNVESEVIVPLVIYSKNNENIFITLSIHDVERGERRYRVAYDGERIVFISDFSDSGFLMTPARLYYAFPPTNLESYLFFKLNQSAIKVLENYLDKYAKELPDEFELEMATYAELERTIGSVSELPDIEMLPPNVFELGVELSCYFDGRKLRTLEIKQISHYVVEHGPPKITFMISRDKSRLYPIYSFETEDTEGLLYIAPLIGIGADLKKAINIISDIFRELNRGAVLLSTMKKLEET